PLMLGLLLTGCVTGLPVLAGPLLRLAGLLPTGISLALAGGQMRRQLTRTALTAGVLFGALTVAVACGSTVRGVVRDLGQWYKRSVVADYMVRGSIPDSAFTLAVPLPETLADALRRSNPAATVDRLSFVPALAGNCPALVLARNFVP